jgi:hypothetical protein
MQAASVLRWIARIWSIASTLLVLAFMLPGESWNPTSNQIVGLLFFPLGMVLGFVIAWWREGVGGTVTVGSMALFYLWMWSRDGRIPAGPYFLLLAAPGLLFIVSALLSKLRGSGVAGKAT